ncbi:MAG: NADH-quinone oxidoreductase subunit M [Chloroherpetonaceae bacterium]|nr:NADH-quinone oxidoreductase subunit M [Chloroherpetonaceae bacterium]
MSRFLLSQIIAAPLFLSLLLFLLPKNQKNSSARFVALMISLVPLVMTLILVIAFEPAGGFQFVDEGLYHWLGERTDIKYLIGLDGSSMLLFLFSTIVFPLVILGSWEEGKDKPREFFFFLLFLETAVLGIFASLDLFLFYMFWEAMLIPMYFLIGIWGNDKREKTALQFILFMLTSSLLMLIGIIYLGYLGGLQNEGIFTTDYRKLQGISITIETESILFWLFAISFLVKAPMIPFHTWLPEVYRNSPIGAVVAGVLLKMATYALVRFNIGLFPSASLEYAPLIAGFAVFGILYGAIIALRETDLRLVIAYSSISHLGFLLLGIFALTEVSLQGAILQMMNHGLSTALLLYLASMIQLRGGSLQLDEYGGLKKSAPFLSLFFLLASLSSIGLPGLNGFIGEFLILTGSFYSIATKSGVFSVLAALGVILSAAYMLRPIKKIFYGELNGDWEKKFADLTPREMALASILTLLIIWIGVYPKPFLKFSAETTHEIVSKVSKAQLTLQSPTKAQ